VERIRRFAAPFSRGMGGMDSKHEKAPPFGGAFERQVFWTTGLVIHPAHAAHPKSRCDFGR